jgi:hypothetical protein
MSIDAGVELPPWLQVGSSAFYCYLYWPRVGPLRAPVLQGT